MSELAWPIVAAFGLVLAYRFGQRYVPARDHLTKLAKYVTETTDELRARVIAIEGLKSEMTDALEGARTAVETMAGLSDRLGTLELKSGLEQ